MVEKLINITQRGYASCGSAADLAQDVDKLEVAAITVLYDIEASRRRLGIAPDDRSERARLLDVATAAAESARKALKATTRPAPTERELAEARTWLDQAREALERIPMDYPDFCQTT